MAILCNTPYGVGEFGVPGPPICYKGCPECALIADDTCNPCKCNSGPGTGVCFGFTNFGVWDTQYGCNNNANPQCCGGTGGCEYCCGTGECGCCCPNTNGPCGCLCLACSDVHPCRVCKQRRDAALWGCDKDDTGGNGNGQNGDGCICNNDSSTGGIGLQQMGFAYSPPSWYSCLQAY